MKDKTKEVTDKSLAITKWKPKPIQVKALVSNKGELHLVDAKEIDAETIRFKDPYTKKKDEWYVGTYPLVGSGMGRWGKRFRIHFVRWGYPMTTDPWTGDVVNPQKMFNKLKGEGLVDDKGYYLHPASGQKVELFDDKGNFIRAWHIHDVTEMEFLKSETAQKVRHDLIMSLGVAMKTNPLGKKEWVMITLIIANAVMFCFYVYFVLKGAGYSV